MTNSVARKRSTRKPKFTSKKGDKAMKSIRILATMFFVATLATTAFAQPAEPPSAPPSAPPATTGTTTPPDPSAPAPAAAKAEPQSESPFMFKTMKEMLNAYPFFVNFGAKMGVEWAGTVESQTIATALGKVKTEGDREESAKILSRIPKGATAVFQYIGEKPMDDAAFVAWLGSNDCKFVSKDEELELETWSDGCKTLSDKLSPLVLAAIDASQASSVVKGNAKFTHDKAMKLTAGDEKVAMLHLAALAIPFEEWPKAFGVTDDLNVLVGKPACFLPDGEEARCGTVEAADASGVTINGETVPWEQILGEGPALGFGDIEKMKANWGKGAGGGYPNSGLGVYAAFGLDRIMTPEGMTDAHAMYGDLGLRYKFEIPLAIMAFVGPYGVLAGGITEFQTEGTGEGLALRAGGAVEFDPRFDDTWGMEVTATGYGLSSGGGGASLKVAPKIHFGPDQQMSLSIGPQVGYMHYGEPMGDNPTAPRLEDPVLEGVTLGGQLKFNWTIVPHGD